MAVMDDCRSRQPSERRRTQCCRAACARQRRSFSTPAEMGCGILRQLPHQTGHPVFAQTARRITLSRREITHINRKGDTHMMTDKDQTGDPEPPGGTDPGLAQPTDADTSAYSQD